MSYEWFNRENGFNIWHFKHSCRLYDLDFWKEMVANKWYVCEAHKYKIFKTWPVYKRHNFISNSFYLFHLIAFYFNLKLMSVSFNFNFIIAHRELTQLKRGHTFIKHKRYLLWLSFLWNKCLHPVWKFNFSFIVFHLVSFISDTQKKVIYRYITLYYTKIPDSQQQFRQFRWRFSSVLNLFFSIYA